MKHFWSKTPIVICISSMKYFKLKTLFLMIKLSRNDTKEINVSIQSGEIKQTFYQNDKQQKPVSIRESFVLH